MAYGTLRADLIENTNGLTGNAIGPGFKNRIINGDMRIDQRNAGASVSIDGTTSYTVDRWSGSDATDGVFTLQQNTSAPAGFVNSLKFTTTTADASLGATQYAFIQQPIEGTNISDLAWGSASAKTVTLSFWVRSSLTGTFAGSLRNSATNRSYPFTYTISVADTWEQKTITIAGDTSGTWLTTTGIGIYVAFGLGVGSTFSGTAGAWAGANYVSATGATSVIGTLNATFYITGVQLEVGPSATSFDYRPYGTELMLCQRYCSVWRATTATQSYSNAAAIGATDIRAAVQYPVEMRAAPTITYSGTFDVRSATLDSKTFTFNAASNIGVMSYSASGSAVNNATAGESLVIRAVNASTSYVTYSAEL